MTSVALPNGKTIHFSREQTIAWSVVLGLLGAGFIDGLYFGITQVNWQVFWLKPGWDGLFSQGWWPVYRHTAFRDIPGPAFATMGVLTVLAKQKYWDNPVKTWRLAATPLAVIVLTLALGVLGTWILNFAFGHPVLQWHSVGNLVLGVVIGRIMHILWAPVGATYQGMLLEHGADRAAARHKVPVWVKLPLAPPAIRGRFTKLYLASRKVVGNLYDTSPARAWIIGFGVLLFVVITAIGLIGHWYVGTGHELAWLPTTRG